MPTRKPQVKQETSLDKVTVNSVQSGRLKSTESSARGGAKDIGDVTLVPFPSGDQERSVVHTARSRAALRAEKEKGQGMFVPVVDRKQVPLMPTTPSRARRWIKTGKATPFWKRGVFCVRLNVEPLGRELQAVVVGIDPGSKREAFTVKSEKHTYLNVLTETVYWVKEAMHARKSARMARRWRKTPYRVHKLNRSRGGTPPSSKARWQWKIRIAKWLLRMFPIKVFAVEDVKAKTTGGRKWNVSFSPLGAGKNWFYAELKKLGKLETVIGYETCALRNVLGLKKSSSKLADRFECHNVDSWVLAWFAVGGRRPPENKEIIKLVPLRFHRRQLHRSQPAKGGVRAQYGGTRSLGFTRGSIVRHPVRGVCYVGGTMKNWVSLYCPVTGRRITKEAKPKDIKFLSYASWRKESGLSLAASQG